MENGLFLNIYKFQDLYKITPIKKIEIEDFQKDQYSIKKYFIIKDGKRKEYISRHEISEVNDFSKKIIKELKGINKKALRYYKRKNNKRAVNEYKKFFEKYIFTEYSFYPLYETDKKVVNILNDYGYFLELTGFYEDSIQILEQVKYLDSKRVVTYLNLADSQFKLSKFYPNISSRVKFQEHSKKYYDYNGAKEYSDLVKDYKKNYKTYIDLMKKSGRAKRIPKRVYARLKL